jgi:hypothetical protein
MKTNAAGKAAAFLIFFSLFSGCGELETLLPSTGTYQVRTLVNGSSIESCSIIRSDDKIRPYFAVSVVDDPDLIGLLVYFENPQGEVVGEKIRYILKTYAEEVKSAETETKEGAKPDTANDIASEETKKTTEEEVITTEKITEKTEEAEKKEVKEQKAGELPEQGTVREKWSFTDVKPIVKNTGVDIVVKSLSDELPYLPLPKTLEIGPYTMVFEAIGLKETLSRTETCIFYLSSAEFYLKDISIYLSGQSGSQLISPGTIVMLEARLDFDSRLDPYVIWYNGKNIISQGKISSGAGTILWKTPEQAGFYSLRLEVFPFLLKRSNYTGISREITLPISPKAVNLGYFFENNREHTARSPLAAGTTYPEQVRLITAMIAAMKESGDPSENTKKTEKDKAKQNMPAEPAALPATLPPVLPPPPELLQWYQFEGSLHNSMSPLTDTQSLLPVNKKAPRWAAVGQSYGLSTGSDEVYLLSPVKFFRKESEQGGGVFLFHIMPATEGVIFSAFFPLQSSSTNGVRMDMVRKENTITLRLSAEGAIVEIPAYLTFFEPQNLIPIAVEFYIRPYRLEAKLSLSEEYSPENKVGNIKLPGALSGECVIRLGGGMDTPMVDKSVTDKSTANKSTTDKSITDKLATDKLATDKLTTDKSTADKSITDKLATDKLTTDKSTTDKSTIDKSTVDKLTTDKSMTDKSTTDKSTADKSKAETSSKVQSSAQSTPIVTEPSFEETLTTITATADSIEKGVGITTASEISSPAVNQNTIWNEFAILFSTVPLLEEELPAELTNEKQDTAKVTAAGLKSENPVPAVQNKAAASKSDSKPDSKPDTKSDSKPANKPAESKPVESKPAENKPAANSSPVVTGSLSSLSPTPLSTSLKEEIPTPDKDETEINATEGDENLISPEADNSIPEIAPSPPPAENKLITSN